MRAERGFVVARLGAACCLSRCVPAAKRPCWSVGQDLLAYSLATNVEYVKSGFPAGTLPMDD